ncbi:MAG: AMP-binding protein [Candidatus Lokiarchaeota archaeon]|nr:AMP-binding protein [Candidatus Lokiarchaeota archaeon]
MIRTNIDERNPWFNAKYWPPHMPKQLEFDETKTLYDAFVESAEKYSDEDAFWFLDSWMTYGEMHQAIDNFAAGLNALGMNKGDVFGILLPNCYQFIIAYYACLKIGVITTPMNPTYKPGEILHQLKMTKVKALIILDSLNEGLLQPVREKYPLKFVISTGILDFAKFSPIKKILAKLLKKVPTGKVPNSIKIHQVLNLGKKSPVEKAQLDPLNDVATYLMTGGTTGIPKAAVLTHSNIYTNAKQCSWWVLFQKEEDGEFLKITPKTGMVGVLPFFHSFGMTVVMNAAIISGGSIIMFPRPPPTEELLGTLHDIPLDSFMYPGAEVLFQRIADLPQEIIDKYDLRGKLTMCLSGAGPLHEYVRQPFEAKTGGKIVEGYGLTETSPVLSAGNFYGEYRCVETIGLPFPGVDWKIFPSEDFNTGPIEGFGEEYTGEICASGPQIMKEYLDRPEETADTIKEWKGKYWLRTGDIGFMDEFGRMVIRDRKKQLIKMRGYSIYPKEVETLVGNHPDVLEVAVAGLPDKETGELVKAWVKVKVGSNLTPDALRDWCKENMTHYKVPKLIEFRDEIPKNIIGKVQRRLLQEQDPLYQNE